MHIEVDLLRIDLEKKEISGCCQEAESFIGLVNRMRDGLVLYRPPVDEYELVRSGVPEIAALDKKTASPSHPDVSSISPARTHLHTPA